MSEKHQETLSQTHVHYSRYIDELLFLSNINGQFVFQHNTVEHCLFLYDVLHVKKHICSSFRDHTDDVASKK